MASENPEAFGCRISSCDETIPVSRLMCHRHWFMVPAAMKTEVNEAYARYRRALPKTGTGTRLGKARHDPEEYRKAMEALTQAQQRAVHFVETKLAEREAKRDA